MITKYQVTMYSAQRHGFECNASILTNVTTTEATGIQILNQSSH